MPLKVIFGKGVASRPVKEAHKLSHKDNFCDYCFIGRGVMTFRCFLQHSKTELLLDHNCVSDYEVAHCMRGSRENMRSDFLNLFQ